MRLTKFIYTSFITNRIRCVVINGLKFGSWIHYWENGSIARTSSYTYNIEHGKYIVYGLGRYIGTIMDISHNKKHGIVLNFDPNGLINNTCIYINGIEQCKFPCY